MPGATLGLIATRTDKVSEQARLEERKGTVQIKVQLFSILRECLPPDAERGQTTISLAENATVADLVAHLGIDRYLGFATDDIITKASWQVMVSGHFEMDMGRVLQDGDEVQIFPPVAGG